MKFLANLVHAIMVKPSEAIAKKIPLLKPAVDAQNDFFFGVPHETPGAPHIRDRVDIKRFMALVIVALAPCALFGIAKFGTYTILVILTSYVVGGTIEAIFAIVRKHEINEGFLVTGLIYPLTLPPGTPLWIVGLGIAFGVIFGKEIFGGTGQNPWNPALLARCFVYICFPVPMTQYWIRPLPELAGIVGAGGMLVMPWGDQLSGQTPEPHNVAVWEASLGKGVDVVTKATPLTTGKAIGWDKVDVLWSQQGALAVKSAELGQPVEILEAKAWSSYSVGPRDTFYLDDLVFGNRPGSIGETAPIVIVLAGMFLLFTRVANYRTVAGAFIGAVAFSAVGHALDPVKVAPVHITLLSGGFLYGAFFMATDPVSGPAQHRARWLYGAGIGALTVLIRSYSGYPEGMMFAVLCMNMVAPIMDHLVLTSKWKAVNA